MSVHNNNMQRSVRRHRAHERKSILVLVLAVWGPGSRGCVGWLRLGVVVIPLGGLRGPTGPALQLVGLRRVGELGYGPGILALRVCSCSLMASTAHPSWLLYLRHHIH